MRSQPCRRRPWVARRNRAARRRDAGHDAGERAEQRTEPRLNRLLLRFVFGKGKADELSTTLDGLLGRGARWAGTQRHVQVGGGIQCRRAGGAGESAVEEKSG